MKFSKIAMLGLGYIGLPTAAVFASRKIHVVGVDVSQKTVDTINRGEVHIVEPDLDMVVHAAVTEGYLRATTVPEAADAFLIAVPTPFKGDNHEPDLSYVQAAAKSIAPVLAKGNLVVLESTSPVGTTEKMAEWLAAERPDLTLPQTHGEESDIRVAHCPERVLPGKVLQELVQNDRVIGGMTARCSEAATALYKTFVKGECVVTNARTAEMCKLTENSFRDVNIAFANELSLICDKMGINIWELIQLANRHPRVNILQPGAGVGGHCIAVDPWFIASAFPDLARIISTSRKVNDEKPRWIAGKVISAAAGIAKPTIACLGLSFKPDIDDLRESPALEVAKILSEVPAARLLVVEPHIDDLPVELRGMAELCDAKSAIRQANVVALLVGHSQFRVLSPADFSEAQVVDACGLLQVLRSSSRRTMALSVMDR